MGLYWFVIVLLLLGVLALNIYLWHLRGEMLRSKRQYSAIVSNRDNETKQAQNLLESANKALLQLKSEYGRLAKHKGELDVQIQDVRKQNPPFKKLVYNVGVVGISSSGKSALINKLIDPGFIDISGLMQTQRNEQRERTVVVSYNVKNYTRTEHVLRFHEWGGEYLVEAQSDMLNMCRSDYRTDQNGLVVNAGVQVLVFVVDIAFPENPDGYVSAGIGTPNEHVFSRNRIAKQVNEYFSIHALKFLLNDRILPYLHLVVLFVNKSDRLSGNHEESNEKAKEYFRELIMGLRNRTPAVEVIVGSAYTEASLHTLFATVATKILPQEAWEGSLRPIEGSTLFPLRSGSPVTLSPSRIEVAERFSESSAEPMV